MSVKRKMKVRETPYPILPYFCFMFCLSGLYCLYWIMSKLSSFCAFIFCRVIITLFLFKISSTKDSYPYPAQLSKPHWRKVSLRTRPTALKRCYEWSVSVAGWALLTPPLSPPESSTSPGSTVLWTITASCSPVWRDRLSVSGCSATCAGYLRCTSWVEAPWPSWPSLWNFYNRYRIWSVSWSKETRHELLNLITIHTFSTGCSRSAPRDDCHPHFHSLTPATDLSSPSFLQVWCKALW